MNDAGSTLTEYAMIAALVSIVILAVSADLGFPGAPVAALSEVASGPWEAGSPGLGSKSQAHPHGGQSLAGEASGSGSHHGARTNSVVPMPGAGASGPAQGTWIEPTAKTSPRPRDPDPSGPGLFDTDAAMAEAFAQLDDPTESANSAAPDEETAGRRGRQPGDRSAGGGTAAEIRRIAPSRPTQRLDPAAEQLVSLRPGSDAEALNADRASFGGTAGTARGAAAQEIPTRATSGFSRPSARPANARAMVVTSTFHMGDRRLWALIVLMLVGLGFGAHRLRRRLSGGSGVAHPIRQSPKSTITR